jgi:hypothetical protein
MNGWDFHELSLKLFWGKFRNSYCLGWEIQKFTFTCVCFLNLNSEGVGLQFSPISMIKLERGSKLAITRCSNSIQHHAHLKIKRWIQQLHIALLYTLKKNKKNCEPCHRFCKDCSHGKVVGLGEGCESQLSSHA